MSERLVTIDEVGAAFETLLEVVGRECDAKTVRTVHFTGVDVLQILRGEWEDGRVEPVVAEEPDAPRCPGCDQSLTGIRRSQFACPECYAEFGEDAVEAALWPF